MLGYSQTVRKWQKKPYFIGFLRSLLIKVSGVRVSDGAPKYTPKSRKTSGSGVYFCLFLTKIGVFSDFFKKSFRCVLVSFFFGCSQITRKFYNKKDRLFCLSFSYCAVPFEKISWHSALGEKLLDCIASATGYDSNGFSARLRYYENVCHAITSLRVVEVLVNCAAMSGRAFFSPAVSTLEEVTVL